MNGPLLDVAEARAALPVLAALLAIGELGLASTSADLNEVAGHQIFTNQRRQIGLARSNCDRVDEYGENIVLHRHESHVNEPTVLISSTANICTSCILDWMMNDRPDLTDTALNALTAMVVAAGIEEFPLVQVRLEDLDHELRSL